MMSFTKFDEMFLQILSKYATLNSNVLRTNHVPYTVKPLRKAIMKMSYLENLISKKKCANHSFRNYKKQKSHYSRLYKKDRKSFFNKLNISFMLDNILFKKTFKPSLSNKGSNQAKIKLAGGDKLLQHDSEVAEG